MSQRLLLSAKARVHHAALALREFTVAELVAFSGVKRVTVQGVINRDNGKYFDVLEVLPTGRRGGQPHRYRFRVEKRELVEEEFKSLSQEPLGAISRPSVENRFWIALAAARTAFESAVSESNPEVSTRLRRLLPPHLRALQGALKLAAASDQYTAMKARLDELTSQMESRGDTATPPPRPTSVTRPQLPALPLQSPAILTSWLMDWTADDNEIAQEIGTKTAECDYARVALRDLLGGSAEFLQVPHPLLPAAALAVDTISDSNLGAIRQSIVQHLYAQEASVQSNRLAALVGCAAVSGAREALGPLLNIVTRPDFNAHIEGEQRQIILRGIARFAKPGAQSDPQAAALICYILMSRCTVEERNREWPLLLPASIQDDLLYRRGLLDDFARARYANRAFAGLSGPPDECSLMRNLAVAFCADRLQTLSAILPGFLDSDHGIRFLTALSRRDYSAIRLRTDDAVDFMISPGKSLINANLAEAYGVPLSVHPYGEQGRALMGVIRQSSSTLRGDFMRPQEQWARLLRVA